MGAGRTVHKGRPARRSLRPAFALRHKGVNRAWRRIETVGDAAHHCDISGAELIHLPNTLARRIGPRVRVFSALMLRKAEIALAKISENFEVWLHIDIEALDAAKIEILSQGLTEQRLLELDRCARLLRGAGATFGYPIVSQFAEHLHEAIVGRGASLSPTVIAAMKKRFHDKFSAPGAPAVAKTATAAAPSAKPALKKG